LIAYLKNKATGHWGSIFKGSAKGLRQTNDCPCRLVPRVLRPPYSIIRVAAAGEVAGYLLLKHQRRPANSLPLEVDSHLDAVGDPDEGNALIHPVVLTIEGHCPFDRA
jgi:hypothetical protein